MAELASTLNRSIDPLNLVGQVSKEASPRRRASMVREAQPELLRQESEAARQKSEAERAAKRLQIEEETKLEQGYAAGMGKAREELQGVMEQVPQRRVEEFDPDAGIELAGLVAILGAFAGSMSGQAALQSMKGITEGYRAGKQDLYERSVNEFEAQLKAYKDKVANAKSVYDMALKEEAAKRGAGIARLKAFAPELSDSVAAAHLKANDIKSYGNALNEMGKLGEQMELAAFQAGIKPAAKPRFAQLKVEGTDREGNKKTLVFNPYDENFDPALMENPTPDTPGFAGFAAERAQTIGSRETGFAGRVQQALSSAATDIGNIIKSPGIAEMPVFAGTIGQNPKGVLDSLIALGARGATAEEQRAFQMLTGGISAALGRIESQGLANGTTVANLKAFDEMKPLAGDSPLVTALYLARLKQELEVGLSVYVTNRATSPEQRAQVRSVVQPILDAINFEPSDVLNAMAKSNAGQGTNLLERARRLISQPVGTVADTPQDLSSKYTIANDPAAIQIRRELQNGTITIETARAQLKALGYE